MRKSLIQISEKPTKLRGDLLCFAECGGDPEDIVHGSGYTFDQVRALTPIPTITMAALFDRLACSAPDDFGVRCGLATRFHNMGMLGYRLANCDTLREVIEVWVRYSIIIGYPLASQLSMVQDRWQFSFRPRYPLTPAALRFCMETSLIGPSRSLHEISGIDASVVAYEFPFAAPVDLAPYAALAPAQISFCASSHSGSVFGRRADLSSRLVATNPEARALCEAYCRQELLFLSTRSLIERINAMLADAGDHIPGIATAAKQLGISQRTMHRQLANEESTYRELVQAFRRTRATHLLTHDLPLKSVAFMLGYEDDSSFIRAFKRWYGMSPAQWRAGSHQHFEFDRIGKPNPCLGSEPTYQIDTIP